MGEFLNAFRPDLCVDSVAEIDIVELRARGFDTLMLDLDNTLLPWQSSEVPESSREWVERARSLGMGLCIVSNTHSPRRLQAIAADLGVRSISRALKPRPRGFEKAVKMLDCARERTVVVGDQVLTDILGGNRAGMYTILVKPMHPREFVGTKLSRLIERIILTLLLRRAKSGTNPKSDKSEKQDTK